MASRAKHAERSHYSYHTKAPFTQFHRNAYTREQNKQQMSMMAKAKEAVKSVINNMKKKEGKNGSETRV